MDDLISRQAVLDLFKEYQPNLAVKVYEFGEHRVREHLGGIYDFLQKKQLDTLQQLEVKDAPAMSTLSQGEETEPMSQGKADYQKQKERERRIRQAEKKVKTLEA